MQTVSFMNMKGGVGKTTLAVNIAYALAALHHLKILLVDADPQFNASQYLVSEDAYVAHFADSKKASLLDIFTPKSSGAINTVRGAAKPIYKAKLSLSDCTIKVFGDNKGGRLDVLPSSLTLVEVQYSRRQTEARLKAYLAEKASHYDFVLIDCPPTISFFTEAAVLASDQYIVPIKPDVLSVVGLPLIERYIDEFSDVAGTSIQQLGLVFTMVRGPAPQAMKDIMADIRIQRRNAVFNTHLSQATGVAESVEAHQPIFLFRKSSNRVKLQIVDITLEFLNRARA